MLANGNQPHSVKQHLSKVFQAIDRLKLDQEAAVEGRRPKALGMHSCVGTEYVPFKTPLPLEGKVRRAVRQGGVLVAGDRRSSSPRRHPLKHAAQLEMPHPTPPPCLTPQRQVESYLGRLVDKMRSELRSILADSVADYPARKREEWMMVWPSQTILVGGEEGRAGRWWWPLAACLRLFLQRLASAH